MYFAIIILLTTAISYLIQIKTYNKNGNSAIYTTALTATKIKIRKHRIAPEYKFNKDYILLCGNC